MPNMGLSKSLFKPGEIARIVGARELGNMVHSDHPEYKLAIVLDRHRAIIEHIQMGGPPRPLKDDEYVLIATTASVRVNYLSGVPNPNAKHEFGIDIEPFYEHDIGADRQKRVRCKVGFEFRIAAYNQNIAQTLHGIMREKNTNHLAKKDFLTSMGWRFSDRVHHIVQTFLNANSAADFESFTGRDELNRLARKELTQGLTDQGLEYINLLAHPDKRSSLSRFLVPNPKYDTKPTTSLKLAAYSVGMVGLAVGLLFAAGILPPEGPVPVAKINVINLDPDFGTARCSVNNGPETTSCSGEEGDNITLIRNPNPDRETTDFDYIYMDAGSLCANDNEVCPPGFRAMDTHFRITPGLLDKTINIEASFNRLRIATLSLAANEPPNDTRVTVVGCSSSLACTDSQQGNVRTYSYKYVFNNQDNQAPPLSLTIMTGDEEGDFRWDRFLCDLGDCPNNPREKRVTINLSQHTEITPQFKPTITLSVADSNKGDVSLVNCSDPCTSDRDKWTTPSIQVTSLQGYLVEGIMWCTSPDSNDGCSNTDLDKVATAHTFNNLTIERSAVIIPIFKPKPVVLLPEQNSEEVILSCNTESDGCERTPPWEPELTIQPATGSELLKINCIFDGTPGECPFTSATREDSDTQKGMDIQKVFPSEQRIKFGISLTEEDNRGQTIRFVPEFVPIQSTLTFEGGETGVGSITSTCTGHINGCSRTLPWNNTNVTIAPETGYRILSLSCISRSTELTDNCKQANAQIKNTPKLINSRVAVNVSNIQVDGRVVIVAEFGEIPDTTLTIGASDDGSASITNNGCDSTSTCADQQGWIATVDATPDMGFQLLRYDCFGDDCPDPIPNTEPLNITIDGDITLTPVFEEIPDTTLTIGMAENGSARITNDRCDSEMTCTDQLGWIATLEATANTRFQLLKYSCSGDGCPDPIPNTEPLNITVDGNITLTPVFVPETTLTIAKVENGSARITNDDCGSTMRCTDRLGWTATVEATAEMGFQLLEYSCSGEGCPHTISDTEQIDITVDGDITLTPVFVLETTLTIGRAEDGSAIIINDGCESTSTCTSRRGWTATVEVTIDTGFQLIRYDCFGDDCPDPIPDTEQIDITIDGDITLTPVFGAIPKTILTIGTAKNGSASITNVGCESTSTCTDYQGWTATVKATADTGLQLLRYLCSGNNCPNPIPNTEPLNITVNGHIVLTPVFGIPRTNKLRVLLDDLYVLSEEGGTFRTFNDNLTLRYDGTQVNRAVWAPDGTKFAFISAVFDHPDSSPTHYRENLYVVNKDGTRKDARKLTNYTSSPDLNHRTGFSTPKIVDLFWSPDSARIFFTTDGTEKKGEFEIYSIKPDRTDFRQITSIGGIAYRHFGGIMYESAQLSSDGTKIAFIYCEQVHIVNSTGGSPIRLTNLGNTPSSTFCGDDSPDDTIRENLRWSPDGTKLAFASFDRTNRRHTRGINIIDVDGGNHRQYTGDSNMVPRNPDDSVKWDPHLFSVPHWSPDGTKIATLSSGDKISFIDTDGRHVNRITDNYIHATAIKWSPDGKHVAFIGSGLDGRLLYNVNPSGNNFRQVSNGIRALDFDWSPDSTQLAFLSDDSIYTVDPSGSDLRETPIGYELDSVDSVSYFWIQE